MDLKIDCQVISSLEDSKQCSPENSYHYYLIANIEKMVKVPQNEQFNPSQHDLRKLSLSP